LAVVLRLTVVPASRELFLELDTRVGQALMRSGGPPAALMANIVHPDGDGFVITSVWRTEAEAQTWVGTLLHPLLTELGLAAKSEVRPVWSFARP
jgi:hypothetical protein